MHMIINAADILKHALLCSNNATDIRIKTISNVRCQPSPPVLGGEHHMQQNL